ncbi:MAG: sigma-70 family RNA polymerase sigma factor [Myxococcota bacterium]
MAASTNEASKGESVKRTHRAPSTGAPVATTKKKRRRTKRGASRKDEAAATDTNTTATSETAGDGETGEFLSDSRPASNILDPFDNLSAEDGDEDESESESEGTQRKSGEEGEAQSGTRKSSESDQASFLAMYFREMAALDVLRPDEELSAAKRIEKLEIAVWEQLLSHPQAVSRLLAVIERSEEAVDEEAREEFVEVRQAADEAVKATGKAVRERFTRAAGSCASSLRSIDIDKLFLEACLAELPRIRTAIAGVGTAELDQAFRDYLRRVRSADRAAASARNDFVKANLRLVVSIARRFNHGRMALADLIQEGNIGLMKAVERYDYRRGFRFSTYASWWIRHAISRALADKGREVRLPVHMIDAHHRLSKAKRELTAKLGRQPNNEELAEATELPVEKIEKMRTYLIDQSFSLDRPVNDDDGRSFVEFLEDPAFENNSPTDMLALRDLTDEVRRIMDELKPIEADILRQRFGLDDDQELTLKQIGEKYNLSRERIRQLQEQALSKVRRALQRKDMM